MHNVHTFIPIQEVFTSMTQIRNQLFGVCLMLLISMPMWAQDPGASLGTSLQTMFTGPLVLGLTIVGIVIGGAMIMFGGGMAMRAMGGILLGGVLILDAVKIATYLQSAI